MFLCNSLESGKDAKSLATQHFQSPPHVNVTGKLEFLQVDVMRQLAVAGSMS